MNESVRRVDQATLVYLVIVAGLVTFLGQDLEHRGSILLIYLVSAGSVRFFPYLRAKRLRQPIPFLLDWYPAIAFPFLYKQVGVLAPAIGNWSLTGIIQRWEVGFFNGYPGQWLSEQFSSIWLSEILHLCYFCYVLLLPAVGGYWYFRGRRHAFHQLIFLLSVTYYISFLFYILFPVDSPYYLFTPLAKPASSGFFYRLVHFISDRGGARGGAFPSTHVSASTVILLTALFHQRKLGYCLIPLVIGIYAATVYGRFHYILDVVAGLAMAGVIFAVFRGSAAVKKPTSPGVVPPA